jgi:Transposase DDE domain group 1
MPRPSRRPSTPQLELFRESVPLPPRGAPSWAALPDQTRRHPRAPERVRHGLAEMIRFRALLIAAGYQDANDCDALRADPAFKMAVGRLPESAADLCSQPTSAGYG